MRLPSASALRVFDAAARLGSFKAAAAELGVSPTAVSHRIRSLEDQLGLALFVRKTRKVELTEAGTTLAAATSAAFQRIGDALEELTLVERTLTVSATPTFAALWLVPRIDAFEARHPDIRVHVDTSTATVDLARDRRVDVAIRYGRGSYPGFVAETLFTERVAAFGAPDYLERLPSFEAATLIDTRWRSAALPAITWSDWCALAEETRRRETPDRRFDQEQHVIQAGLAGQGLILVSTLLVEDLVARGWLRPYRPDISLPGLTYASVTTGARAGVLKVRRFLSWLAGQSAQSVHGHPSIRSKS